MRVVPIIYFAGYGLACLAMAAADVFSPAQVAAATSWGVAPGWLREIACFDVFLAVLCGLSLREIGKTSLPRTSAGALTLLSLLIASNNLVAYLQSGRAGHLQGASIHVAAACVGALTVWTLKGESTPARDLLDAKKRADSAPR